MDLLLVLVIMFIPIMASIGVKSNYSKYSKVKNKKELTGAEAARKILDKNGLNDMYVVETDGYLSDHYDPKRKVIRLSKAVYNKSSVAAIAIAAHECGHAIQDNEGYSFMKFRSAIFPFVNVVTNLSYYIILIAIILSLLDLFYIGIAFTFCGLIFQLVTLPVEFNASKRAKEQIEKLGLANHEELTGVKKVLNSAAFTYVAGVLSTILTIIRYIMMFERRR